MPQSITIAAFVFGAVLLLIAILHGNFKIFGAEVSGSAGGFGRVFAGLLGILLIGVGLFGSFDKPATQPVTNPAANSLQTSATDPHPANDSSKPSPGDKEPEKASVPQQAVANQATQPEPVVNISGMWRDPAGSVYQIAQQGEALTIRVSGVNGVGAATGVVRGHHLEDTYEIQYVNGTRSSGQCTATISPEVSVIRGSCFDNVYGQSQNILMR